MISCLVIYTAWSGYRILILLYIIIIKLSCILLDNDTMEWQRKVIIFGGLNFKAQKLLLI